MTSHCRLSALLWIMLATQGATSWADIISYKVTGIADVSVNSVFAADRQYEIVFSIDDGAPDQFPFDSSRGGFFGGLTLLTLPDYAITSEEATNVTGLRQESNALFFTQLGNIWNSGFSLSSLPGGTILDVKQIAPLGVDPVSPAWTGAGLVWELDSGSTVQFNQVDSIQLTNVSAVPEPTCLGVLSLVALGYTRLRRKS